MYLTTSANQPEEVAGDTLGHLEASYTELCKKGKLVSLVKLSLHIHVAVTDLAIPADLN